jgi:hypothetical protein
MQKARDRSWAGGFCIFSYPELDCMCYRDGWLISLFMIAPACGRLGFRRISTCSENDMARDLGWVLARYCGRGFLFIFLLSHNPGVSDGRLIISLLILLGQEGPVGWEASFGC